ncbi:hypothetical protein BKA70DRAFT_829776 [Coprinopsis sp. MPI-PUGE-AT-0042]|nr:hypothetical protein BKA70DRAFT_829776 [Coprinopsis sp. MPI-PUGE-AT-0042]
MVTFTELPLELSLAIAKVTLSDVLVLRLVCKAFAEALMDIALRRIVIDTTGRSEIETCQLEPLKTLAEIDERHPVRGLARILEVKHWNPDPDLQVEAVGHLEAICRNLTRIESLVWSFGSVYLSPGSLNRSNAVVLQALRPMIGRLREVDLLAFQNDQVPILEDLSPLTRLLIQPHPRLPIVVAAPVWKHVINAIERSQDTLRDLILHIEPNDNPNRSIQDALDRSMSLPRLTSLALIDDLGRRSKTTTLPQLSSLQSLSLFGNREGSDIWPESQPDNIFVALKESGIRLQRVAAPQSSPLLDYLGSYEGILQDVEIADPEQPMVGSDDRKALALRFFQKIVPKHQSSLRKIVMISDDEFSGWAFGDPNTSMFMGPLPLLEWLSISIRIAGVSGHLVSTSAQMVALDLTLHARKHS